MEPVPWLLAPVMFLISIGDTIIKPSHAYHHTAGLFRQTAPDSQIDSKQQQITRKSRAILSRCCLVCLLLLFLANDSLIAEVTRSGDVDSSRWPLSSGTPVIVGQSAEGQVRVDQQSSLSSGKAILGDLSGAVGEVTVTDPGSIWNVTGDLQVGNEGQGILRIESEGSVQLPSHRGYSGIVRVNENNTESKIIFDNGSLSAKAVVASPGDLLGVGTIETQGWIFDSDQVFDEPSDLELELLLNSLPGQEVTVDLDLRNAVLFGAGLQGKATVSVEDQTFLLEAEEVVFGVEPSSSGAFVLDHSEVTLESSRTSDLVIGVRGEGLLELRRGSDLDVSSFSDISLGQEPGASGTVVVDDSSWTASTVLVGDQGTGELIVRNGATVANHVTRIAVTEGSDGSVVVEGEGTVLSPLSLDGGIFVGGNGNGELRVSDGGQAIFSRSTIGQLTQDLGQGHGTVIVEGAGTRLDNLSVLTLVRGSMTIRDGGVVSIRDRFVDQAHLHDDEKFETSLSVSGAGSRLEVGVDSQQSFLPRVSLGSTKLLVDKQAEVVIGGDLRIGEEESSISPSGVFLRNGSTIEVLGGVDLFGNILPDSIVANIEGTDTSWSIGESLSISSGTFLVRDGAEVLVGAMDEYSETIVGDAGPAFLSIQGEGTVFHLRSRLEIEDGEVIVSGGAELRMRGVFYNAGEDQPAALKVQGQGSLISLDAVEGTFYFDHIGIEDGGTLRIENSPLFGTGHVTFAIGPAGSGLLDTSSATFVGGRPRGLLLDVLLGEGFFPELGDRYQLVASGVNIESKTRELNLPQLAGGLSWETEFSDTGLMISVVPEPSCLVLLLFGVTLGISAVRRR